MNKTELAEKVAHKSDVTIADAKKSVDAVFDSMVDALKEGERINITGFGIFSVRDTPARQGRNPATGEQIQIAASRSASFKTGAVLKRELKAGM